MEYLRVTTVQRLNWAIEDRVENMKTLYTLRLSEEVKSVITRKDCILMFWWDDMIQPLARVLPIYTYFRVMNALTGMTYERRRSRRCILGNWIIVYPFLGASLGVCQIQVVDSLSFPAGGKCFWPRNFTHKCITVWREWLFAYAKRENSLRAIRAHESKFNTNAEIWP